MTSLTIRTFTPADVPAVVVLQQAYTHVYPSAPVLPGELYLSPAFHGGADVFCAFQEDSLVAYAPVYAQIVENGPADLPHRIWTEVKARPGIAEAEQVKDALLDCVRQHAHALVQPFPGRAVRVLFEYHLEEMPAIDFVLARGFAYTESVFHMCRDLAQPIPAAPVPADIVIRRWKMESEAGQQQYVTARNECFPEAPISLPEWQYYMTSPMWASGTMISAFAGDELVGCVNIYLTNLSEDPSQPGWAGFTEDIFVRASWRGQGIASAMIAEGMRFLQEAGMPEALLAVRALNENALGLYRQLGYQVTEETRFYSQTLLP